MELKRKTPSGTLIARYNQSDEYPGFWIDLWKKNKGMQPVCNIEYSPDDQCVRVIVYADGVDDSPTHIIPISLADCMKW